jgi:hypothetical protein
MDSRFRRESNELDAQSRNESIDGRVVQPRAERATSTRCGGSNEKNTKRQSDGKGVVGKKKVKEDQWGPGACRGRGARKIRVLWGIQSPILMTSMSQRFLVARSHPLVSDGDGEVRGCGLAIDGQPEKRTFQNAIT